MRYETRGDAGWLVFDRPESANALNQETLNEAVELLERAEDERVAVFAGEGEQFCAGGDLEAIASIGGLDEAREFADGVVELLRAVETASVPVIAAVNGDAFGAGFELVTACDLGFAVEGARFGMPETRMGVQPPLTVERVAETAGRKRVSQLALTCEPIDATTAENWGIINRAVPADELEEEVADTVSSVARSDRDAARLTKERITARSDYDGIKERMAQRLSAPETRRRFRAAADEVGDG
ncbi:MAG: enoyl-CoA hydratase/isomerase family protein [Halobacteriales archaeon]